ncbi:T9SS type A sorting domain-containing protein [uncultured Aquimarina sp.]|uniref:T9SS type A sorting domain-containing protein n=1 Tax=uncultured Aquimarina sp. TaxID=575652 RepID=UPI002606D5F6|nr:T9SS type A sorting domain-containing protein [uncultured Aquimarina sp.]
MKRKLLYILFFIVTTAQAQITEIGETLYGTRGGQWFGFSLSTSSDGKRIVVGNPTERTSGFVQVFEKVSGDWVQVGDDIQSILEDEISDLGSGLSVSTNSNGTIVAFGTPSRRNEENLFRAGQVRIYKEQAGNWIKVGNDINGEAEEDYLGSSISLSSDGNTIAIGVPENDDNGVNSGKVIIYRNIEGTWTQMGNDINGKIAYQFLGRSVQLSADGTTLVAGGPGSFNQDILGKAYVYQYIEDVWKQIGTDLEGTYTGAGFGTSVSINNNGTIAAVGSPFGSRVLVYKYGNNTWELVGDVIKVGWNNSFGFAISLNNSGNMLAIGAPYENGPPTQIGMVQVYEKNDDSWIQIGDDIYGTSEYDQLGSAVSFNADGDVLAVATPYSNENGDNSGDVQIFQVEGNILNVDEYASISTSFQIFPNPTSNELNISVVDKAIKKIELYDIKNSLIQEITTNTTTNVLDFSSLYRGIYLLRITLDDGTEIIKKVVKK